MKNSENSRSPPAMMYNRRWHGCVSRKEAVLRGGEKAERKDQQDLLWWRGQGDQNDEHPRGSLSLFSALVFRSSARTPCAWTGWTVNLTFLFSHQSCFFFGYLCTSVESYINAHLLTLQQSSVQTWDECLSRLITLPLTHMASLCEV